ncbi:MAG: acetolactate synthase large subunit [Sphingomonadales bacterium]
MRGADALIDTFVRGGVDMCFANPGTSEMQLVDAIDKRDDIRGILGLHELVCSGAADGYARLSGKPALVVLHLGPGLSNALANLHNAAKARTPVVVVVGDHPKGLRDLDPPLAGDIESIAKGAAKWIGTAKSADDLSPMGADALKAATTAPYGVSVLVVPNDACWEETDICAAPETAAPPIIIDDNRLNAVAEAVKTGEAAFLLGGDALNAEALAQAAAIGGKTGAKILSATFCKKIERGAGVAQIERLPYFPAQVLQTLQGVKTLVLAGARAPLSFFAYPNTPYKLVPEGCEILTLADESENAADALKRLSTVLDAGEKTGVEKQLPALPSGPLTTGAAAQVIGRHLPDNAIISDDATTAGLDCYVATAQSARHEWLNLTGGAIGQGMPLAIGAALAEPRRKVFSLQGDGAGLYSLQALWTQARDNLDITTIIFANGKYRILEMEMMMARGGASGASSLFDLSPPAIDWVKLAEGLGVSAMRATSVEELDKCLEDAKTMAGPKLIEAVVL